MLEYHIAKKGLLLKMFPAWRK